MKRKWLWQILWKLSHGLFIKHRLPSTYRAHWLLKVHLPQVVWLDLIPHLYHLPSLQPWGPLLLITLTLVWKPTEETKNQCPYTQSTFQFSGINTFPVCTKATSSFHMQFSKYTSEPFEICFYNEVRVIFPCCLWNGKKSEMEIKNMELYVSHIPACIHFPQVNLPRIKYLL